MAKSYFKYQQRDAGAQIDWNTVGQSVVKTLNDVVKDRERRKAELDQLSADLGDILQEQPAGTHKGANVFAQQFASNAKNMVGIYYNALKSGKMSPKDFKMRMQALTDGTNQVYDVAQKYQTEYDKFLERTKTGANQEMERYFAERMEGFAKLNDIDSFIDPTTGQVSLGKLVEVDGLKTLSKKPEDIKSIVQLNNILNQKFDRYDLTKDLKKEVDTLGSFVRTISDETNGTIEQLTDVTGGDEFKEQREKFKKVENDVISSIMANPYNVSSILTENLVRNPRTGGSYKITESLDGIPKGERNDYVLVTVDGNGRLIPEYTKDQEDDVREAISTKFRSMLDSEIVSKRGPFAPSRRNTVSREASDEDIVSNISKLYYGDEQELKEAEDTARGFNPNILNINRDKSGVTITYRDGRNPEFIPFDLNGQLRDQKSWTAGSVNFFLPDKRKIGDVNEIISSSGIDLNRSFSEEEMFSGIREVDKISLFNDYYSDLIGTDLFRQDEDSAAIQINDILQGTGLIATSTGRKVKIKNKEGNTLISFDTEPKGSFNETTLDEAEELKRNLLSVINSQVGPERKEELVDRLRLTREEKTETGGASASGGVAR